MIPRPMLLRPGQIPSGDCWAFELKSDGLRVVPAQKGERVPRLWRQRRSRREADERRYGRADRLYWPRACFDFLDVDIGRYLHALPALL